MIVDQELDAVVRAGVFRDREHAIHEAIETLFVVRISSSCDAKKW